MSTKLFFVEDTDVEKELRSFYRKRRLEQKMFTSTITSEEKKELLTLHPMKKQKLFVELESKFRESMIDRFCLFPMRRMSHVEREEEYYRQLNLMIDSLKGNDYYRYISDLSPRYLKPKSNYSIKS